MYYCLVKAHIIDGDENLGPQMWKYFFSFPSHVTYSSTKFSSFQISAGYNAKVQEVSTIDQPKNSESQNIDLSLNRHVLYFVPVF